VTEKNNCTTQTHLVPINHKHTAPHCPCTLRACDLCCTAARRVYVKGEHQLSGNSTTNLAYPACVSRFVLSKLHKINSSMHPTGQTRQWHAELRGDPRASVADRPRVERRFHHGSTFHQGSDGRGPWPQRATLPLERPCDGSSSSAAPWWRTRLERMQRQDQLPERCFEAGENRPRAPQPARRWSTPGPSTRWRSNGFGLRRPSTRQGDTQALREPRSSSHSRLGGTSWRNSNKANNYWDSGQSRATQSEWTPRATYNNHADEGDSDGLTLVSEQNGRRSAQRDPERWQNVSDNDHVRRNVGPYLSRSDDLRFEQHHAVPPWCTNRISRVVDKPGRRSVVPTSHPIPQAFQDSADQVSPAQSVSPVSMGDSPVVRRTRPKVMQGEVNTEAHMNRRPSLVQPHWSQVARKSVASLVRDQDGELDVDDSDTCVQKDSTRKRISSALGKRKMKPHPCLTSDNRSAPQVSVVTATRTMRRYVV
jgi:hypothetical protein